MNLIKDKLCGYEYFIYLPDNTSNYPVAYLHDGDKILKLLPQLLNRNVTFKKKIIIVGITSLDRLSDYSPWYNESINPSFNNFSGKGDEYIKFIDEILKPHIDKNYFTIPDKNNTAMCGFSLGGLISLYSMFVSKSFGNIGVISPSVWFPNFIQFIENNNFKGENLLIVSGENEGQNKPFPLNKSRQCLDKTYSILSQKINNSKIYFDKGNHHENNLQRWQKIFDWLHSINNNH